jgi:translation initiation factor 4E
MRRGKSTKPETEEGNVAAEPAEAPAPPNPYENSIKTMATITTVEEFWASYNYLRRPNDLPTTTDYHFFRDGIKPTWEDSNNARGGKWIVRLPKGLASRYWEEVILALIGGQYPGVPDGEICGAVVSIRYSEDILGIWNRTATDREIIDRLRDAIKRVLQLPPHANLEYKPHQNSIQDKSSFRNTSAWKPKTVAGTGRPEPAPEPRGEARRTGSWGEREKPKGRDTERAWR